MKRRFDCALNWNWSYVDQTLARLLPDVTPESRAQLVTIGGEARHLSPASIDVFRCLVDHDPATVRSLHTGLIRHTAAFRDSPPLDTSRSLP
jgi:hypothetical protein